MNPSRYLCSQLVDVRVSFHGRDAGKFVVNLEEIWQTGAVLEAETAIEQAARVEIRCGSVFFAGTVARVEPHKHGWRFEVEFSPLTPWNPEEFQPLHLLAPWTIKGK
jgi:hypothetical protein